jgi:hypothetical protein
MMIPYLVKEKVPCRFLGWHLILRSPPVGMHVVEPNGQPSSSWTRLNSSSKQPSGFLNRPIPLSAATTSGSGSGDQRSSDSNDLPMVPLRNADRPISPSFSATTYDPPPTYGPEESVLQASPSFSPELARFASANRDVINESLEARLQAAGYLPTDDPSNLTPEEWKNEYGITRLELRRLQDLYSR